MLDNCTNCGKEEKVDSLSGYMCKECLTNFKQARKNCLEQNKGKSVESTRDVEGSTMHYPLDGE